MHVSKSLFFASLIAAAASAADDQRRSASPGPWDPFQSLGASSLKNTGQLADQAAADLAQFTSEETQDASTAIDEETAAVERRDASPGPWDPFQSLGASSLKNTGQLADQAAADLAQFTSEESQDASTAIDEEGAAVGRRDASPGLFGSLANFGADSVSNAGQAAAQALADAGSFASKESQAAATAIDEEGAEMGRRGINFGDIFKDTADLGGNTVDNGGQFAAQLAASLGQFAGEESQDASTAIDQEGAAVGRRSESPTAGVGSPAARARAVVVKYA